LFEVRDIAVVQTDLTPGGAELVSLMQAKELGADLYCSRNRLDGAFPEFAEEIEIHEYGQPVPDSVPLSGTLNAIHTALLRNSDFLEEYDVVVTHKNPAEVLGLRAKQNHGCRYVWYGHNVSEFIWGVWDNEESRFDQETVSALVKAVYRVFGPLLRNADRKAYEEADKVFANSEATKQKFEERIGERKDIEVLYPPIRILGDGETEKERGEHALTVGRVTPNKKAVDAVEACGRVGVDIHIAGSISDEEYREEIEQVAEDHGIEAVFHGYISDKELDELVCSARFGMMPSSNENFGLTPLEMCSSGTPCFVREGCGVTEVYDEDLVFEDIEDLSNRIESDREELENAAARIQEKIEDLNDRHFNRLEEVIL
jgi:glycosyltransferase involved in cell wall biosynthesis